MSLARCAVPAALSLVLLVALAKSAHAQSAVPSDSGAFAAIDSTLVVVVPSEASAASVLGAIRAVRGRTVAAVYTTDDANAWRLGTALARTVGGSVIPYDGAGLTPAMYAVRLLRNAVAANPHGAVLIVGGSALTDPLYREAAAASGVSVPADARAGGRPDGVTVLSVAPNARSLIRARF